MRIAVMLTPIQVILTLNADVATLPTGSRSANTAAHGLCNLCSRMALGLTPNQRLQLRDSTEASA